MVAGAAVFFAGGCGAPKAVEEARPGATASAATPPLAPSETPEAPPAPVEADQGWTVRRVGGDLERTVMREGDVFTTGTARINTPLPEGYPDPTPPGAIELKKYPGVRRAEVSSNTTPDVGMNVGFFPLFNHIKGRQIAMTSPVEMDYKRPPLPRLKDPAEAGEGGGEAGALTGEWTMSFLYRRPEQGALGEDPRNRRVKVVDTAPVTVLSVGFQGVYGVRRVEEGLAQLRAWLAANPGWEEAGDPRALYYNGPDVAAGRSWGEVQVPVRRSGARP